MDADVSPAGDRRVHFDGVRCVSAWRQTERRDEEQGGERLEGGGETVRRVPVAI